MKPIEFDFGLTDTRKLPKEVILRIMHFEQRYRSIDKALQELGTSNILEFSSGLSLRGLDFCRDPNISYVDTDLPDLIATKQALVAEILQMTGGDQPENLIFKAMNALAEAEFINTISIFDDGPISIVNEGLLMYLDVKQKEQLCSIIHRILSTHGGYWITADIYRRDQEERKNIDKYYNVSDKEFVKKHNIEQNKFGSFDEAEALFLRCGFEILQKVEVEKNNLSASKLLLENYPSAEEIFLGSKKTRETWVLKPVPS